MAKRRRQTNGNQGSVPKPADVAANATSTSDSGEPVSAGDTATEVAGELVAVDGVNKPDQGSVSDGAKDLQTATDTGGETAKADLAAGADDSDGDGDGDHAIPGGVEAGDNEANRRHQGDAGGPSADAGGQSADPARGNSDAGHVDAGGNGSANVAGSGPEGSEPDGSGDAQCDAGDDLGVSATAELAAEQAAGGSAGEEVDAGDDIEPTCPICAGGFEPSDLCSTDIEEGTCHAECLEGSPVVSLTTGQATDGPMHTFVYVEEMIDDMRASAELQAALQSPIGKDLRTVFELAAIGAGLQHEIRKLTREEGPFKDWVPELSPVEIVGDLNAALVHAKEKRGRLANFAEDADPREVVAFFAWAILNGVHGTVDNARSILEDGEPTEDPVLTIDATEELVELVRKIGDHATPEVMAHHLVITKHRQSPELTLPESIAFKAFASVLRDLDACADGIKARRAAEAVETPTPKRLPIDETNMEAADGPLDTWPW